MVHDAQGTRGLPGDGYLDRARANFSPIALFLEQLDQTVMKQPPSCELRLVEAMRQSAVNTCEVLYTVQGAGDRILTLRFTMVGEAAEMILFQSHQSAGLKGVPPKGGPVDQHVYRMEEREALTKVVQRRITTFLAKP